MDDRGQSDFARLPRFAARLYAALTQTGPILSQHREIADDLISRIEGGTVLDIGTGPGRLLEEVHRRRPDFRLYGLDISAAMVEMARKNLGGLGIEFQQGDIRHAPFRDHFFDLVTCTGSFYLWTEPREGLDEIFRILKPGRAAYLYETYSDCDLDAVREAFRANLRNENLLRRFIAPRLFLKQLRMTYRTDEIEAIVAGTRFSGSFSMDRIVLARMPAWVRITLMKTA